MRAKDTLALEALRAVKSAILLQQTESGAKENCGRRRNQITTTFGETKKDSAAIYTQQGKRLLNLSCCKPL